MLFPSQEDLPRVWKSVVEGTINNRLGCSAKVATDDGRPGERLICVYTKDFSNTDDVLRVLKELAAMGLVNARRRVIAGTRHVRSIWMRRVMINHLLEYRVESGNSYPNQKI
jgi:hypothetical protein